MSVSEHIYTPSTLIIIILCKMIYFVKAIISHFSCPVMEKDSGTFSRPVSAIAPSYIIKELSVTNVTNLIGEIAPLSVF